MSKSKLSNPTITVLAVAVAIVLMVSLVLLAARVWDVPEAYAQGEAIILSAFFGAILTAIVTYVVLNSRVKAEAKKEKDIKIHENKIEVYSSFIEKLWRTMEDEILEEEEMRDIRKETFGKLIFYLKPGSIEKLSDAIEELGTTRVKVAVTEKEKQCKPDKIRELLTTITNILRDDLNDIETDKKLGLGVGLWNNFHLPPIEESDEFEEENGGDNDSRHENTGTPVEKISDGVSPEGATNSTTDSDSTIKQFLDGRERWHFCEWGSEQLDVLDKMAETKNDLADGELSLVEYGDTHWRTDLVKQIKSGDVVFLFKGGGKYAGAFIAKGWRVFEYSTDENGTKMVEETTSSAEIDNQVVRRGEKISVDDDVKKKLLEHDIYKSIDDGSTLCANVIIGEAIAYSRNGVINPNATYRKTISRYGGDRAFRLLKNFVDNDPMAITRIRSVNQTR